MDNAKELRMYRKSLFTDAIKRGKKPDRVPLYSNQANWMFLNSGVPLSQTLKDYELMRKLQVEFQQKYQYDKPATQGGRNPLLVADALELSGHIINDDLGTVSIKDVKYMREDDYSVILDKGFKNWLLEDYLPRKIVSEDAADFERKLTAGMKAMLELFGFTGASSEDMFNMGGLDGGKSFVLQPACILMNWYRGIANFSVDLRRRKELVKQTLDLMWKETSAFGNTVNAAADSDLKGAYVNRAFLDVSDPEYRFAVDHWGSILSNAIMNAKQFGEFIWPYLGQVVSYAEQNDQTLFLYAEADVLRFKDYFNNVKPGCMTVALEQDDLFKAKKEIGEHITLTGGYPVAYLYSKTIPEALDLCKKIMDEVAYDGNYIYSENKIVSHKNDCREDNLEAVLNFFKNTKYQ